MWKGLICIMAASLASGCYRYTATDVTAAPAGQAVRILVTRQGASQLAQITPIGAVSGTITGTMAGVEDDDLLLNVSVGERRDGFLTVDLMQTIRVPTGEILSLEKRELDKVGTGFAIAGASALAVGIVFGIIEGFGIGSPPDDGPPVDDFSFDIALLSFLFGR